MISSIHVLVPFVVKKLDMTGVDEYRFLDESYQSLKFRHDGREWI